MIKNSIVYKRNFKLEDNTAYKYINKIFNNKTYGDFVVVGVFDKVNSQKRYICKFLKTEYVTLAKSTEILSGEIKDPYYPSIYNVGYLGEMNRCSKIHTRIYNMWTNMLMRCYSKDYHKHKPTYTDCSTETSWHNFTNFYNDIIKRDDYRFYNDRNIKFCLDKDLSVFKNKIYSNKNCSIIPIGLNSIINIFKNGNKDVGVFYLSDRKKWKSTISINKKTKNIGNFDTKIEAKSAYINALINKIENLKYNQVLFCKTIILLDNYLKNVKGVILNG